MSYVVVSAVLSSSVVAYVMLSAVVSSSMVSYAVVSSSVVSYVEATGECCGGYHVYEW